MNNNEITYSTEVKRPGELKHVILHTVLQLNKNDKVQLSANLNCQGMKAATRLNQSYHEGRLVFYTE